MSCRETLVSQRLATVRSVVAEASSGGRISDDRTEKLFQHLYPILVDVGYPLWCALSNAQLNTVAQQLSASPINPNNILLVAWKKYLHGEVDSKLLQRATPAAVEEVAEVASALVQQLLPGDALKLAELLNVAVEVFRNFTAQSSPFNTDKVWKEKTANDPLTPLVEEWQRLLRLRAAFGNFNMHRNLLLNSKSGPAAAVPSGQLPDISSSAAPSVSVSASNFVVAVNPLPPGDLPLLFRKNLRDNQVTIDTALQSLKTALGSDTKLQVNWHDVIPKFASLGYENRAAECVAQFVRAFATNALDFVKDPLNKEALLEVWTDGVVEVVVDLRLSVPHDLQFENGKMKIITRGMEDVSLCGKFLDKKF